MKSVRMLAAGAVALFALSFMTAPVRACDDRFIKKCEAEAEAAFVAESQTTTAPMPKRKTQRGHPAFERPNVQRTRAPRFIARTRPAAPATMTLASEDERPLALPESPLARRFRGFIDPQPMTLNSFEALRGPRLEPEHLAPAATLPANDAAAASDDASMAADISTAVVPAAVVTVPPPAAAAVAPVAAAPAATPAPVFAQTAEASSEDGAAGGFPFHKLVLTLCGALGVASALRFIVRA